MKNYAVAAATLLSATYTGAVELTERALRERDLCAAGSVDVGGNWYCQAVEAVTYTNVGPLDTSKLSNNPYKYLPVTGMSDSGVCTQGDPRYFSGNLSPFDEEVSLHFRGPLTLKQLAVYVPSGSKTRRDDAAAHQHLARHAHAHAHHERAVGDMVTAIINGQVVSWTNEYAGEAATAPAAGAGSSQVITATIDGKVVSWTTYFGAEPTASAAAAPAAAGKPNVINNLAMGVGPNAAQLPAASAAEASKAAAAPAAASTGSSSSSYGSSSSGGAWTRQGYYDSASQTLQGLVFLNHEGGTNGSGTFDYNYGNSLSYSNVDGTYGAASSQILADTLLADGAEVVVMTDSPCSGSDCGFVRDKTVAYHGFDGAEKVFLMEFGMPLSGKQSASIYSPADMPAIWMLNAQIPRTLQYGPSACSCWISGCGEFDIFEVLAPGDTRCKSTVHGIANGGDSDYFNRPTSGTIKAAVVMSSNQIHIKILDSSTSFGSGLSSDFVDGIASQTQSTLTSLFNIAAAA